LVYAFNLHGTLFWDDNDWIVNNPAVHSLSWESIKFWFTHNTLAGIGLKSNYYRPFLFFTFAINYVIGGVKPFGYHLLSNLIHIGNAILVFYLLNLATKKRLVAFLAALFFIIHPLQTEAVSYISGRGDPQNVLFMLLALLLFFLAERGGLPWKSWRRWLSLGFLILALLSRETAIIFPLLLMVFYVAFTPHLLRTDALRETEGKSAKGAGFLSGERFLRSLKTAFIKALPYFTVVFIYGILRLTVLNFKNVLDFYDQPNIYSSHLYVRLFTFLKVLLVYFKLLFVPVGLHMERGMDPQLSFWKWPVWFGGLVIAGIIVVLFALYKKERDTVLNPKPQIPNLNQTPNPKKDWKLEIGNWKFPKISDFRVWFFGIGWFFIALAPVSGITPINALIYEHWLYLPMIGFWFIAAFYLAKILKFFRDKNSIFYFLLSIFLAGYFVFFGWQSIKRNILWSNPLQFYENILKYEPDSVRINNNVGNLYYNEGDIAKAEEYYRKAVTGEDIFPQPHFNLGSILQARGDIFGAIQEYKKAIELDPNFYYAYQNLTSIYAQQGDLDNAILMLEKLKELRPQDPRILYNLGLVYFTQGKKDLARENLNLALKFSANDPQTAAEAQKLLGGLGK